MMPGGEWVRQRRFQARSDRIIEKIAASWRTPSITTADRRRPSRWKPALAASRSPASFSTAT